MELAKDNYSHNIPKDWITAKVWDVLCKNPVYKDYVKKHSRYVNEKLHKNSEKTIDKPSEINYINNTNETTTKNSKGDKTMMNTITQIIKTAKSYGFKAKVDKQDNKTVWIWSNCDDIETAPNYDDLYCALGEFSNVDFQTDDDKMEVWIKG